MNENLLKKLNDIPNDILQGLSFSFPWQHSPESDTDQRDPDGFSTGDSGQTYDGWTREEIRSECWRKFNNNPQINTSIRGMQGRLTGLGFECSSGNFEIRKVIEEIWYDYRNRLYHYMPKFVAREHVEGELFLLFTVHSDGFIEVDFLDPSTIGGGCDDIGIIFHPFKSTFPLFYNIKDDKSIGGGFSYQIPSINIAFNPLLVNAARSHQDFKTKAQTFCKTRKKAFRKLGGYYRFVVAWDRGLLVKRAVSYLRTTLAWINQYELLKEYEIDHKKSSGSYLWVFTIEDPASFKLWLALTDEERRKTGIMSKKTPGGSLVLPPGMTVEVKNPNLPSINEQDTDLLKMVGSGLNEEEGVMTGKSTSPYASIKASRGPMSDRTSDEIAWFRSFLQFDFWNAVFTLKSKLGLFEEFIEEEECVGYTSTSKKNEEGETEYKHTPIFEKVKKRPCFLVEISFPSSEMVDYEARAKGMLGVKHGPISETLGIPNSEIAAKMGFGSYASGRLRKETEKKKYPPLVYNLDAESLQEKAEAEPKKSKPKESVANKKE